jgi:hypothetical protein
MIDRIGATAGCAQAAHQINELDSYSVNVEFLEGQWSAIERVPEPVSRSAFCRFFVHRVASLGGGGTHGFRVSESRRGRSPKQRPMRATAKEDA